VLPAAGSPLFAIALPQRSANKRMDKQADINIRVFMAWVFNCNSNLFFMDPVLKWINCDNSNPVPKKKYGSIYLVILYLNVSHRGLEQQGSVEYINTTLLNVTYDAVFQLPSCTVVFFNMCLYFQH
jgi:hypothetical protein